MRDAFSMDLDGVFDDFDPNSESTKGYKPITVWLPPTHKEAFDELQKKSSREFGRRIRKLIIGAINKVTSKTP
jgi:hypothetical protein